MPEIQEITYEEALHLEDPIFIDVRAPVEYSADHIPGSVNIPVFDNAERSLIGTMYRTCGQSSAIARGVEIVGNRLGSIVQEIIKIRGRSIVIYCFRGGMRSTSLVSLLLSLGISVKKLKNGYKGYRAYVRDRINNLEIIPPVFVLHGLTGTGKTEILRRLKNSLDLEDFAGHRSSVFGGLGLLEKSQKLFEGLLLCRVFELADAGYAVIEGESRKIGNIHLPGFVMNRMSNSPCILIRASIERRVAILLQEYRTDEHAEEIIAIVKSLGPGIGKNNVNLLIELFSHGELEEFTKVLLEKYYDPLYARTLDKINFIAEVENVDSNGAAQEVEAIIKKFLTMHSGCGDRKF